MDKKKKTILLVEDEIIVAMAEAADLEHEGYAMLQANSGEEAVTAFRENPGIDLVLMDIDLGHGMDGTEAAALILKQRDVPVVFLSSHTEPEIVEKTEKITSYGYVTKNSGITVLSTSIKMAFRLHEAHLDIRNSGEKLARGEERIRFALDTAQSGTWEWDLETDENYWSDELWKVYGLKPHSCKPSYEAWRDIILPEDRPAIEKAVQEAAIRGTYLKAEWRVRDADGTVRWLMSRGRPFRDTGGNITRYIGIVIDITDRKRAEELLNQNQLILEMALENARADVWEMNLATGELTYTWRFAASLGYEPGEIPMNIESIAGIIHEDDLPGNYAALQAYLDGAAGVYETECRLRKKDGSWVWVLSRGMAVERDPAGKPLRLMGTTIDISERKKADQDIAFSEDKLSKAFRANPEAMTIASMKDGTYLDVNDIFLIKTGFQREEVIGHTSTDLDIWVNNGDSNRYIESLHSQGRLRDFPVKYRMRSGEIRDFSVSSEIIDIAGEQCSLNIIQDITERKWAEMEREAFVHVLRLNNEKTDHHEFMKSVALFMQEWAGCEAVGIRLREGHDYPYFETRGFPAEFVMLENSLCATDPDGQLLRDDAGNPVLECMCGNVLCGRYDPSLSFFSEHGSFWSNCTTELLATTTEADRQSRTRNRCNGMGYESVALIPLRQGGVTFGLLQLNDKREGRFTPAMIGILERLCDSIAVAMSHRALAENLKASEEKFRTVSDFTYDWEYWAGPDGRFIYVSPSCKRVTGYAPEEYMDIQCFLKAVTHPDDYEAVMDHLAWSLSPDYRPDEVGIDFRVLHPDGKVTWVGHRCAPVFRADGTWQGVRGSNRDITDHKRTEAALEQSLKDKDLLMNELHHRVKNNLGIVASLLSLGMKRFDDEKPEAVFTDAIGRIHSISSLYEQLNRSSSIKDVNMAPYIQNVSRQLVNTYAAEPGAAGLTLVCADITLDLKRAVPLGLILNELVTNALKYARTAGTEAVLRIALEQKDGNIVLAVSDNGPGLPGGFNADTSGSTGLKLVGMLARQIGGSLTLESRKGLTARVTFSAAAGGTV